MGWPPMTRPGGSYQSAETRSTPSWPERPSARRIPPSIPSASAATPTPAAKLRGGVGDSPIIGAGLYVDGKVGAATATGRGEEMIKTCASFSIIDNMRRGMEPIDALRDCMQRQLARRGGDSQTDISFLT